ncbi:hypothetical protein Tco_0786562 [Tanacetum coccineum]
MGPNDSYLRVLMESWGIDEALEEKQPAQMKDDVWKTMQKKASSTIRLALAPEIKYSVLKEKTPKDICDKLTNIYASKSLTHRLFLKMKLYSLKLEEGSNLHDLLLSCEGLSHIEPRFEKKESYNLEEAITRRTKTLFLVCHILHNGILREEKPKWVLDNATSSHICNDRAMFETLNANG